MRKLATVALMLAGCLGMCTAVGAAAPSNLVDRIVAVVDDDPIFLSDVRRVVALGLVEPLPEENERRLQRRVLDGLIEQRLRFHEVERYDSGPLPVELLERRLEEIRGRYPDRAAFEGHLVELGIAEEDLRYLLARQLRILLYVDERLGPRVFVDLEDVRSYYELELVPRLTAEGAAVPPLEEAREQIRSLLREIRLNEEIETWTEGLRLEAEIFDYLERSEEALPPVVRHLEIE